MKIRCNSPRELQLVVNVGDPDARYFFKPVKDFPFRYPVTIDQDTNLFHESTDPAAVPFKTWAALRRRETGSMYTHDLRGLLAALEDTAEGWRMLADGVVSRKKEIEIFQGVPYWCPCCEFTHHNEIKFFIDPCINCPLFGCWQSGGGGCCSGAINKPGLYHQYTYSAGNPDIARIIADTAAERAEVVRKAVMRLVYNKGN